MTRHESRATAFALVFQLPINDTRVPEIFDDLEGDEEIEIDDFCRALVTLTLDNLSDIDETIRPHLKKWTLERLPKTSLGVLRISCAQLMYMPEIPESVVINEAVELAKEYGSDDEYQFVNGVLRSVYEKSKGEKE